MSEQERILERIKKILAKVNHAGGATVASEEEMAGALEMARKLASQIDLDEGYFEKLVQGSEEARQSAFDSMIDEMAYYRKDFRGIEFFLDLAKAVTYVTDTDYHLAWEMLKGKRGTGLDYQQAVKFFGMPRDVAVAVAMYKEMVITVHAMARLRCGKGGWTLSHNSYALGLCERLRSRAYTLKTATAAAKGSDEAGKAGAIVLSKDALLKRYGWEKLGRAKPLTEAEKAELAREREERLAKHERLMKDDPDYRRAYEREQKKAANRKGPRARSIDERAYNKGYADAESVSLGTNGISGKESEKLA